MLTTQKQDLIDIWGAVKWRDTNTEIEAIPKEEQEADEAILKAIQEAEEAIQKAAAEKKANEEYIEAEKAIKKTAAAEKEVEKEVEEVEEALTAAVNEEEEAEEANTVAVNAEKEVEEAEEAKFLINLLDQQEKITNDIIKILFTAPHANQQTQIANLKRQIENPAEYENQLHYPQNQIKRDISLVTELEQIIKNHPDIDQIPPSSSDDQKLGKYLDNIDKIFDLNATKYLEDRVYNEEILSTLFNDTSQQHLKQNYNTQIMDQYNQSYDTLVKYKDESIAKVTRAAKVARAAAAKVAAAKVARAAEAAPVPAAEALSAVVPPEAETAAAAAAAEAAEAAEAAAVEAAAAVKAAAVKAAAVEAGHVDIALKLLNQQYYMGTQINTYLFTTKLSLKREQLSRIKTYLDKYLKTPDNSNIPQQDQTNKYLEFVKKLTQMTELQQKLSITDKNIDLIDRPSFIKYPQAYLTNIHNIYDLTYTILNSDLIYNIQLWDRFSKHIQISQKTLENEKYKTDLNNNLKKIKTDDDS